MSWTLVLEKIQAARLEFIVLYIFYIYNVFSHHGFTSLSLFLNHRPLERTGRPVISGSHCSERLGLLNFKLKIQKERNAAFTAKEKGLVLLNLGFNFCHRYTFG